MSHDLKSPSLHFKFPQAAIAEIVAFMDVVIKTRRWRYPRSCGQMDLEFHMLASSIPVQHC